jgi:dihydroneopterin aldolase/2-amino-4-hydroxy-6-hydroxymethyldihydropteridine diphosphokinase
MAIVYIGVGSNIEAEKNVRAALRLLGRRVKLLAVSTFYRTEPLGATGSPRFVNGVVGVETDIGPRELKFGVLRKIEEQLGRKRGADKYAPRTIDLDILVYDADEIAEPDLTIPDPDIESRAFIALPLAELAPDMALPGSGRRLAEVAQSLPVAGVTPLYDLTELLRLEVGHEP